MASVCADGAGLDLLHSDQAGDQREAGRRADRGRRTRDWRSARGCARPSRSGPSSRTGRPATLGCARSCSSSPSNPTRWCVRCRRRTCAHHPGDRAWRRWGSACWPWRASPSSPGHRPTRRPAASACCLSAQYIGTDHEFMLMSRRLTAGRAGGEGVDQLGAVRVQHAGLPGIGVFQGLLALNGRQGLGEGAGEGDGEGEGAGDGAGEGAGDGAPVLYSSQDFDWPGAGSSRSTTGAGDLAWRWRSCRSSPCPRRR